MVIDVNWVHQVHVEANECAITDDDSEQRTTHMANIGVVTDA